MAKARVIFFTGNIGGACAGRLSADDDRRVKNRPRSALAAAASLKEKKQSAAAAAATAQWPLTTAAVELIPYVRTGGGRSSNM